MNVGTIRQEGDFLITDNTNIAYQHAENLQMSIEFDGKFDGYSWIFFCGYSYNQPKALPVPYNAETKLITLPPEAFKKDGVLYIQGVVIKDGVKFPLAPVKFYLGESLPQDFIGTGKSELEALQELIRQVVGNEYDATLQVLIKNATAEQLKAEEQQEKAEQQQTKAQEQQVKAEEQQTKAQEQQVKAKEQQLLVQQQQIKIGEQQEQLDNAIDTANTNISDLTAEATKQQGVVTELVNTATDTIGTLNDVAESLQEEATRHQGVVNTLVDTTNNLVTKSTEDIGKLVTDTQTAVSELEREATEQQTLAEQQQTKATELQNTLNTNLEEYKQKLDNGEFTPEHKWEGTTLFLKHSDGTWGDGVDLHGDVNMLLVELLPQVGQEKTLYLLKEGVDVATLKLYIYSSVWYCIGGDVDLTDYLTKTAADERFLNINGGTIKGIVEIPNDGSSGAVLSDGTTLLSAKYSKYNQNEVAIGDAKDNLVIDVKAKNINLKAASMLFSGADAAEFFIPANFQNSTKFSGKAEFSEYSEPVINNVKIATVNQVPPVGSIMAYAGTSVPAGWLLCDGTAYKKTDYVDLFNVIGNLYGPYSDQMFNLPDLRERVPVGQGTTQEFRMLGVTGGEKTNKLKAGEIPLHTTEITSVQTGATITSVAESSENAPHNNMQPYIVLAYIIKY